MRDTSRLVECDTARMRSARASARRAKYSRPACIMAGTPAGGASTSVKSWMVSTSRVGTTAGA